MGMHKSGTTLVARMLHRSGIDMGDGIDIRRSYDSGEKFERESTKAINQAILGSEGMFSLDIAAPAVPIEVSGDRLAEIRRIVRERDSTARDWGFKDPRTCLTYPIWAEELPEHRLIVVFRSHQAMWARFRPLEWRRVSTRAYRLVQRWCEHYGRLLDYLERGVTRAVVIDYERLMIDDREFRRLEKFVGRDLPDERLPKIHRGREEAYPALRVVRYLVRAREGLDADEIADRFRAIIREQVRQSAQPMSRETLLNPLSRRSRRPGNAGPISRE